MDLRKLKKLIDLVEESGIAELEVTEGEEKVRIVKNTAFAASQPVYAYPQQAAPMAPPPASPKKLAAAGLKEKAQTLLKVLENNPYQNPPPYEKPVGDLQGVLSRRINIQHRLVYEVFDVEKTVKVMRMWTHYE